MDYLYTRYLWADSHTPPVLHGIYVTSSGERHSSGFRFLHFLCLWMKIAAIWLRSQPPNYVVIPIWYREFSKELSRWYLLVTPYFNRHWTCLVKNPEYAAGYPSFPSENSRHINSFLLLTLDGAVWCMDVAIPMIPHFFGRSQIFLIALLIHT